MKIDFGNTPEAADAAEGLAAGGGRGGSDHRRAQASASASRGRPAARRCPPICPAAKSRSTCPRKSSIVPRTASGKLIGYDRQETLVFKRPKLEVLVTLIPKFACEDAPECGVKEAPRPEGLIEGNRYDTQRGRRDHHRQVRLSPADLSPAGLLRRQRLDALAEHALEHPCGLGGMHPTVRAVPAGAK